MPTRHVPTAARIDLAETLRPLRRGTNDPTMRIRGTVVERASRTPEGPVAVRLAPAEGGVEVEAWGPGATWLLDRAPAWCGALDDDEGFEPPRGRVRELWRRHRGLRIPRTGLVAERLIAVVLEQKVTSNEARRGYQRLARTLAEPAPGPLGLSLPPDPARVAEVPTHRFHPFGVEQRRATVVREVARRAAWLDATAEMPLAEAEERIGRLPGIGPWSVAEVARTALGDADAVSVGDYHLKNLVAWVLAGEPRGSDERMLELLEPYRPHRGRVQAVLEIARLRPPAFGPRSEPRLIDRI